MVSLIQGFFSMEWVVGILRSTRVPQVPIHRMKNRVNEKRANQERETGDE